MYQQDRRRLAGKLKALRVSAGLSGSRLAEQLGWTQSRVSRIETAKQLPTEDDLAAWTAHLDAASALDELLAVLRQARVEYAAWKEHFRSAGSASVQTDILTMELQTTTISEFQPSMIPGLVQTAEYARELLHQPSGPGAFGASEDDIESMVAVRMQRQQALYDPGKQVGIVILEAALHTRICSTATHAAQLDRLIGLSGLANLQLGIVPFETTVPVFPLSGFRLYDGLVVVESVAGEQQLADDDDIALYTRFYELLNDAAEHGPATARIIQRAQAAVGGGGGG